MLKLATSGVQLGVRIVHDVFMERKIADILVDSLV